MEAVRFKGVVFDLGNVLVEWDPRRIFSDECLREIDFFEWNARLDAGAPFAETVAAVRARFPQWAEQLDRFRDAWPDILGPVDHAVVAIVDELRRRGVPVYVLSNSSTETLPRSAEVQALLAKFDGVLLSGEVGILKPDQAIFDVAAERFGLDPAHTLFVDDSQANVDAALACGWQGHRFTEAGLIPVDGRSS